MARTLLALALVLGVVGASGGIGLAGSGDGLLIAPAPARVALSVDGQSLDGSATLVDGTTLVSLDDISTALDLTYGGLRDNLATVSHGDHKVTFSLGSIWAVASGHEVLVPVIPVQAGDQVVVPLRFLLENLGFEVKWLGGLENTVDIRPIAENDLIVGTIRERQVTSDLEIDVQYPRIAGLDSGVQSQLNAFFADRAEPVIQQGYASQADSAASDLYHWTTQVACNYRIAYNQQGLLSIVFDDYLFTGGAHGATTRSGYTVDIATGKAYALKDLFTPGTDYVSLLSAEVKEQIAAQGLQTLSPFDQIRDDQDFYIQGGYLVIYFQQYDLMPYAFGFPEFKIPLASLEDVLVPALSGLDWGAE